MKEDQISQVEGHIFNENPCNLEDTNYKSDVYTCPFTFAYQKCTFTTKRCKVRKNIINYS